MRSGVCWDLGVPCRCHGGLTFPSHSLPLHFHRSKIFQRDEAAIRSPCVLPIPFASTATLPPLSSLKSLHSSRQLSSGKRLAFWGVGGVGGVGGGALLRQRCRVLCARAYTRRVEREGGGTWRLGRKQPPLDDETGALFVYLPGSAGEVLATLD